MGILETINNLLSGATLEDEIAALIQEKRVCKHVGAVKRKRTKRGKLFATKERRCVGRPDPAKSRKIKRSLRSGATKQKRSRAQRNRWRNP